MQRVAEMGYSRNSSSTELIPSSRQQNNSETTTQINRQILLQIPGCTVHLMDKRGQVLELSRGQFTLIQILDKSTPVATIIKVGDNNDHLQWPLTRDEPVLKIDRLHYLFSLLINETYPLNYGVTFSEKYSHGLASLDSYLKQNSCFSCASSSSKSKTVSEWEQFSPRIGEYNNVLAKAIAEGSGHIVKGILVCSSAYSAQVQNGGQMVLNNKKQKNQWTASRTNSMKTAEDTTAIQESLKRARNLSKMTENISKAVLDGVVAVTGILMSSLLFSQAGKAFLCSPTGQLLQASLDALNAIMEAAEVAGKQALSATSSATTSLVADKMGERAGEATEDALATAGHCANTAWNVMKIRKAINPQSTVSAGLKRTQQPT